MTAALKLLPAWVTTRLKAARLRHNACLEDINYRSPRGLHKCLILQLGSGQWLNDGLNLIIGGHIGVGKTSLACPWLTTPAGTVTACGTCACCA